MEYKTKTIDDIDSLRNRRVRTSGELIRNQINGGLVNLRKSIQKQMKEKKNRIHLQNLLTTKHVNGSLREFFGTNPLSQYMDQTNSLAEITHKRRITSLGPGALNVKVQFKLEAYTLLITAGFVLLKHQKVETQG